MAHCFAAASAAFKQVSWQVGVAIASWELNAKTIISLLSFMDGPPFVAILLGTLRAIMPPLQREISLLKTSKYETITS